ncbi:c-type cytochrome [Vandammella animalimorsus]|uniref:c-type cytochrome n=1 Tax=Vandammella animalimorsus TaxID=2029117 RepID=UPI0031BBB1AF
MISSTFRRLALLCCALGLPLAAAASEQLIKSKACIACHSVERKIVGPSFKDIAAKRHAEDGAAAAMAERIRKGSKGQWGPVPMPPNTRVNEAEAQALAQWILSLHPASAAPAKAPPASDQATNSAKGSPKDQPKEDKAKPTAKP